MDEDENTWCQNCERLQLELQRAAQELQDVYSLLESRDAQPNEPAPALILAREREKRISAEARAAYLEGQAENLYADNESLRGHLALALEERESRRERGREREREVTKQQQRTTPLRRSPRPPKESPSDATPSSTLLHANAQFIAQLSKLSDLLDRSSLVSLEHKTLDADADAGADANVAGLQHQHLTRDLTDLLRRVSVHNNEQRDHYSHNYDYLRRIEAKLDALATRNAPPPNENNDDKDVLTRRSRTGDIIPATSTPSLNVSFVPPAPCTSFTEYARRWDHAAAAAAAPAHQISHSTPPRA